jgi:hypothetical protein
MIGMFVEAVAGHRQPYVGWIVQESGCWEWTGTRTTSRGYGTICIKGQKYPAHRLTYERVNGPVPSGLQLDHLCRNRICVNPAHLEAVTHRENQLRGDGWGGRNARKTHCDHGHPLSGDNIIRDRREPTWRKCRECSRRRSREWERANPRPKSQRRSKV